MARNFEITINDVVYSGHTASAKDQIEMLHAAARTNAISILKEGVADQTIVGVLMFSNITDIELLKKLCLRNGNVIRSTDKVPVDSNLFQDEIHYFYLLLGKVLRENIGNFWQLSQNENKEVEVV